MKRSMLGTALILFAGSVSAAQEHLFENLRLAVAAQRPQISQALRDELKREAVNVVDCSVYEPIGAHDPRIRPTRAQYIFNAPYMWGEIDGRHGRCIVLDHPIARPLSRSEALDALTAARIPFPVPFYLQTVEPLEPVRPPEGKSCDPMPVVNGLTHEVTIAPCP